MELELKVLIDVVSRLNKLEIPYMVTGSLAMNFYAEPRMTRDIDIVIELEAINQGLFISEFEGEYLVSEEAIDEAIKFNYLFNIIHKELVFKVDFIIRKRNEYSQIAFSNRKEIDFEGRKISIISKNDLVIAKITWAEETRSAKQKKDIINLLKTDCNLDYIIKKLKKLNLHNFAEEFIGERYF